MDNQWVSVDEKIPGLYVPCLVCANKMYYIAFRAEEIKKCILPWKRSKNRIFWSHILGVEIENIKHWMPLPKPPEIT